MKIGVFGGSFNPPHKMHKNMALELINKGYLDKVIFVPTGNKYKKDGLISDIDRYNMLKLMCKKNNNLKVSKYELSKNLRYAYETLDHFQKLYKNDEVYFILGSDNLKLFKTWKNYEYILSNYKLLIVLRDNDDVLSLLDEFKEYENSLIFVDIDKKDLSSTLIRNDLKNNKTDHLDELEEAVLKYIRENNLYV